MIIEKGSLMLKKLFITTAAAAAVSVPLAGAAWAAPSDNNPPGKGGVPSEAGSALAALGLPTDPFKPTDPSSTDPRVSPGSAFSQAAKLPGNTPTAYGNLLNGTFQTVNIDTDFGPTKPGQVTKLFTPGCNQGNSSQVPDSGNPAVGGCF
jgi:hypothetical protein